MSIYNNILLLRNAQGQLEKLVFNPPKRIAVVVTERDSTTGVAKSTEDVDADVIFSYDHNASVRITENPVEEGVKVNDHRIIEPKRLSIEVGISNIVGVKDVLFGSKTNIIQATKLLIFGNRFDAQSKVAATYSQLLMSMYDGDPFELTTPYGIYSNMVITSVESMQDSETISVFKGRISFQEFIMYSTQLNKKITTKAGVLPSVYDGTKTPIKQTIVPKGFSYPW